MANLAATFGLATQQLEDDCKLLARSEYETYRLRAIRNNNIRDASINGVKQSIIVRLTGLSRQAITNIISKSYEPVPPAWKD